jgi:hypothetical protein
MMPSRNAPKPASGLSMPPKATLVSQPEAICADDTG